MDYYGSVDIESMRGCLLHGLMKQNIQNTFLKVLFAYEVVKFLDYHCFLNHHECLLNLK